MFGYSKCSVIIDNWTSHWAKIIAQFFRKTEWNVYYLTPYPPQLAPVEVVFAIIKKEFIKSWVNQMADWNKSEIYAKLLSSLKWLREDSWRNIFIKILKQFISIIEESLWHFN